MAGIVLEGVRSEPHDGRCVIDGLDLTVADGEVLGLLGASGSGKTTLLRLIAGLAPISSGSVHIGGRDMRGVPTRDRDVAMVVQDDALLPHLSAGGNMGFGLRLRKMLGREVERRVADQARVLGLSELLERAPRTLSGGQQRATALGRALVRAPEVFLLDEPLARLDAGERARLRAELVTRVTRHGTTTILVTNDPVEAMAVGSRLAVLAGGRIAQVGRPQEVYDAPAGVAVAQLVGDPPMGLVEGVLEPGGRTCWVRVGTQRVRVTPPPHATRRRYEGATVHLGVRAEHARPGADLLGTVVHAAPTGASLLVGIVLPGAPGSALQLRLAIGPVPHRGSAVAFALDPDALRLFDPLTGLALPRD